MKQNLEYPPRPEGSVPEQIAQLWSWLYRLAERLNAEQQKTGGSRDG